MLSLRLLSAFLGIILVIIIMTVPNLYFNIALVIIALIGLKELFRAFKAYNLHPVSWIGYFSVFSIFLITDLNNATGIKLFLFFLFIIVLALFLHIILSNNRITFIDASVTLFGIFYITFLVLFIVLTRNMDKGNLFVWLILIGGWITDSAAYFTGKSIGRNKLVPTLSPKKTIEGAVGGIIGCTSIIAAYGLFINTYYAVNISIVHYVILGILLSIVSQIGDMAASAIKRLVKIKDFGNIMPGHGGVIDRFDSIFFAAPVVYFYLNFIIK